MDIWLIFRVTSQMIAHNGVDDEPVEVAFALLSIFAIAWILIIVIGDRKKTRKVQKSAESSTDENDERLS